MEDCQILIVGAGPVGLALGITLKRAGFDCLLVDAREAESATRDPRALALSDGSRQLLMRLGVWGALRPTPIGRIHVSHRGRFGRSLICAADHGLPALGYVQEAGALAGVLRAAAESERLPIFDGTRVANVAAGAEDAIISTLAGEVPHPIRARLVAHAEGTISDTWGVIEQRYDQHAVVTIAGADPPAGDTAYERFTPLGPLALLPLRGAYSVVFAAPEAEARALASLPDKDFLARLQEHFGERVTFTSVAARAVFPLALRYRLKQVARREVWLGNAAQTLHPVAGQGFNLALRDVWALSEQLRREPRADPGGERLLAAFAASRRLDRIGVIRVTDALVRLFSNDQPLLAAARGSGMLALDLLPPLKDFFARRMMYGARGG